MAHPLPWKKIGPYAYVRSRLKTELFARSYTSADYINVNSALPWLLRDSL